MFVLKLVFLLASSFLISAAFGEGEPAAQGNYNDGMSPPTSGCGNCTICPYQCHNSPPPPSTPASGYPWYGAPPPPAPVQAYCPPAGPVQCCGSGGGGQYYSPPNAYNYYPYNYTSSAELQFLVKPFISRGLLVSFLLPVMFLVLQG